MTSVHLGRNIVQIRELLGIEQKMLASKMGVSQQTISRIEQSEHIEDEKLEKTGTVMGVTAEAIKNFNKESIVNHINNFHCKVDTQIHTQVNPLEKIIELYEKLLAAEREKNTEL